MLHSIQSSVRIILCTLLTVSLSIVGLLTSGCNSDQSAKPRQVTIAVQSLPNDESIARAWYQEQLGKSLGVKVIVLHYDSSALVNKVMTTDNVDIAVLGTATAAISISKGIPYEIFWIHNVEGDNEALAVKNDANIETISDLHGKRIAVPFGSTAHYALLHAMHQAGLSTNDIIIFDLQPPEILNAWRQNQIDAAFVWQPTLEELLIDGHILVSGRTLDRQGITTADLGIVNRKFAQENPDILQKYIELQIKAHDLYRNDPKQAASIASINLEIPRSNALKYMNELVWIAPDEQLSDHCLGTSEKKGHLAQTLADTAHWLEKYDIVDRAAPLETFEQSINPSFIEAINKR